MPSGALLRDTGTGRTLGTRLGATWGFSTVGVSKLRAWSASEYIGTRSPLPLSLFDFNCQHLFPGLGRGSHADHE